MARLGDIFTISSGGTPNKNESSYYTNGTIPWVRTGDLKDKYVSKGIECITEEGLNHSTAKLFPKDTVLVAMYGATIGACSILLYEASTNQACAAFLPRKDVLPEYLYYFLNSKKDQFIKDGVGGAQPNISAGYLKNVKFELVSLDEQQKIIDKLSMVDDLISLRKQQLSKLDELVKSRFIEMFGDIREVVSVSYYIKALTAGKSLAGEEECANKVLKTGAATYDEFDATQVKNLPVDYTPVPEHLLKDGDIIISRMNTAELVGATAYVWKAPQNTYLPDRLWRAELKPNTNAIFVWQMLIQPSTKEQICREASGTSGSMKNISKPGLLGLQVKKVPLEMQNQFATFVEQVDKSKFEIQKSLEKLETLKKALMQKYFG